MSNGAPEKIYLNIGNEESTYQEANQAGAEITWCCDQIDEWDVEYTRSDLYEAAQQRIRELEEALAVIQGET